MNAKDFARSLEKRPRGAAAKALTAQNLKARQLHDAVVSLTPKRTGATAAAWEVEQAARPGDVAHVRNPLRHIGRLDREHRIVDLAIERVKK